jgi:hypothetical protein
VFLKTVGKGEKKISLSVIFKGEKTSDFHLFFWFDIEYNSNDDRRNNKSEQFSPGSTYVIMEKKNNTRATHRHFF